MAKKTSTKKPEENPEIARLRAELEESEQSKLRLAADYANLQKRYEEQSRVVRETAKIAILERLFPVLDNFYRASTHAPAIDLSDTKNVNDDMLQKIRSYFDGLRMTEKQLETVLSEAGLSRIPTKGEAFNPNLHEAISFEQNADVAEDYIIDEIESGWQIDGKVIRPAKVRVSKG